MSKKDNKHSPPLIIILILDMRSARIKLGLNIIQNNTIFHKFNEILQLVFSWPHTDYGIMLYPEIRYQYNKNLFKNKVLNRKTFG